ncbi:unnamed protein product [Haemonchus placei]|uniref:Core-2/I-Branching enzyme n=1 Tax=Haemonchus placei TaxID=6290 RepID=A0A3P7WV04_HAEPC|nr:unnamed protein product [Haemonchus placei]
MSPNDKRCSRPNRIEFRRAICRAHPRTHHSLTAPKFMHRPETSHLDCRRLFLNDHHYMAEVGRSRIALIESTVLDMDCESVRLRVLPRFPLPTTGYGIAFARIVHTDYEFVEEQLRVNFSPENHYCYHVDSKSPAVFKERMAKLSSCLPNVYLTKDYLDVDGATGRNVNFAHMACLKILETKDAWQYVIPQQVGDQPIIKKMTADEMLMSSLQIPDEWEMPGRFTKQCFMNNSVSYKGITRRKDSECKAGFLRHEVCVQGVENLPSISWYFIRNMFQMMPSFDYGAIACVSELLFNRTYLGQNDHPLNMTVYENLPTVQNKFFFRYDFTMASTTPIFYVRTYNNYENKVHKNQ